MLPNGDLAILGAESLTIFDGTQWKQVAEVQRPTQILKTNNGSYLIGHSEGISKIVSDSSGRNVFSPITPPEFTAKSLHSPKFVAEARGHYFGVHGTHLTVVDPNGKFNFYELENWASSLFAIGEEVYFTGGLLTLLNRWDWERKELVRNDSVLNDSVYEWFTDITPRAKGGVWILSNQKKIIGFDGEKTWLWPGNAVLAEADTTFTCFTEVSPGQLAIGTTTLGILQFDANGSLISSITKDRGLNSDSVIGIGTDNQAGIWAATNRGVNRFSTKPNTYLFDERHGISSAVTAIEHFNNRVYLATSTGIFSSNPQASKISDLFVKVLNLTDAADMLIFHDHLIVVGHGIYSIGKDGIPTQISEKGGNCLWQPSFHPHLVLVGHYEGTSSFHYANRKWSNLEPIPGAKKEVFSFAESDTGTILAGNGDSSISRIHFTDTGAYSERIPLGVPTGGVWTSGTTIEGKIYTNTEVTLRWDDTQNRFVQEDLIGSFKGAPPYGFENTFGDGESHYWVRVNSRKGKALPRPNLLTVAEISSLSDANETRASSLLYDPDGCVWAGGAFGLILGTKPVGKVPPSPARVDMHRLISMNDNQNLAVRTDSSGTLNIGPDQNSIRIEAAFNNLINASRNTYQIHIRGLDANWSTYSPFAFREVTNLAPGNYEIFINGRNLYGQEAQFRLPIYVDSPWYQKSWAYALFIAIAVLLIMVISMAYNRGQIIQRKRLERIVQERTEEVEDQNRTLIQQADTLEKQNHELEEKTEELTATTETLSSTLAQLQTTQDQLVETARTAGKAEIAINVLHNVGNVLNSLNVSLELVSEKVDTSKVAKLHLIVGLMQEHKDDLDTFITQDPKGKNVLKYLIHLSESLDEESLSFKHELSLMREDVDHIKSIITAQQAHAKNRSIFETIDIRTLVENALAIHGTDITRNPFEIINDIPEQLEIKNDKHRLIEIILNLINNARDAISEEKPEIGTITFSAEPSEDRQFIKLRIKDNGTGIEAETMRKLFQHGFTTKASGHGFGLHSCANAAKPLGCTLDLDSPGKGLGTTATLTIPIAYTPNPEKD